MSEAPSASLWAQWIVAALLILSGLLALLAGWGITRLRDYLQRMHPTALVTTGSVWCSTLAVVVYFSALHDRISLRTWLIIIMMSITVPITTLILARTDLFRRRQRSDPNMPTPLGLRPNNPSENSVPPETE